MPELPAVNDDTRLVVYIFIFVGVCFTGHPSMDVKEIESNQYLLLHLYLPDTLNFKQAIPVDQALCFSLCVLLDGQRNAVTDTRQHCGE